MQLTLTKFAHCIPMKVRRNITLLSITFIWVIASLWRIKYTRQQESYRKWCHFATLNILFVGMTYPNGLKRAIRIVHWFAMCNVIQMRAQKLIILTLALYVICIVLHFWSIISTTTKNRNNIMKLNPVTSQLRSLCLHM